MGKLVSNDFLRPPAALTPKGRGLKFLPIVNNINVSSLHTSARTCVPTCVRARAPKTDFTGKFLIFPNILLILGSQDPLILVQCVQKLAYTLSMGQIKAL